MLQFLTRKGGALLTIVLITQPGMHDACVHFSVPPCRSHFDGLVFALLLLKLGWLGWAFVGETAWRGDLSGMRRLRERGGSAGVKHAGVSIEAAPWHHGCGSKPMVPFWGR